MCVFVFVFVLFQHYLFLFVYFILFYSVLLLLLLFCNFVLAFDVQLHDIPERGIFDDEGMFFSRYVLLNSCIFFLALQIRRNSKVLIIY